MSEIVLKPYPFCQSENVRLMSNMTKNVEKTETSAALPEGWEKERMP